MFVFRFLYWIVWAGATAFVLDQGRRQATQGVRHWRWWMHPLACIGIGLVSAVWSATLEYMLDPWLAWHVPAWPVLWQQHFVGGVLADVVLYATVFAIGYGVRMREGLMLAQAERARLGEQLARAQLDALRRQIEPHFLFNTLNTISGLVREARNDAAVATIAGLGELLRRVLDDAGRGVVTLGEELAFLDTFLAIQQMRFGERLAVSVRVPDALRAARVPGLLLQPLVENAFQHGLARRAQGGTLEIAAAAEDGMLMLTIYNDGPPLPSCALPASGIGLANVGERLATLYGDRGTLDLRNRGDGVGARVVLPLADA